MLTGPPMTDTVSVVVSIAYFLSIFLLSLSVYIQTRKMESFSFHKGIKYFRNTFIFFSLIYLFRFLLLNLQLFTGSIAPDLAVAIQSIGQFLVIYFSVMAIFSLLSSFSWKKYSFITDNRLNLLAVTLSCVAFFLKLPSIMLAVGIAAAAFLVLAAYDRSKNKARVFSPLFVVYALLIFFILFDLIPDVQQLIQFQLSVVGYFGSICVFVYINLKVRRVLAAGEEKKK
jgi:hypothetical protein